MRDFFVQPWLAYGDGETIEIDGKRKTYRELRIQKYENIIDEALFISRATEGAVSVEWVMDQPISIRKKYVKDLEKELREREEKINKGTTSKKG